MTQYCESSCGTLARKRRTIANGIYSVAEYISTPLGLLISTPYLLRHMGATQFGVWVLANSVASGGSTLSTGFGDAAIKYVAMYRGKGDAAGVARIVQGMIFINLTLGAFLAVAVWGLAPFAASRIVSIDANMRQACQQSFRIAGLVLAVRSIDGVFGSTLRAFERYDTAVRISIYSRIIVLVTAIALVARGLGVVKIMLATLCVSAVAAVVQGRALKVTAGKIRLLPSLHRETLTTLAGFGCFSWLQALSAVFFGQADRLVIGMLMGAPTVAVYALCDQAAQSIHGTVAAAFHVLFPHLSTRLERESPTEVRYTLWAAFRLNVALSMLLGVPMIVLSRSILTIWISHGFAEQAWPMLSILAAGSALLAMNVTAYYGLLAAGRIRLVMSVNLAAGAAMLLAMILLTPRFGAVGTACGWLIPGPITCLLYLSLYRSFRHRSAARPELLSNTLLENSR
jgi:O-antigen/teichoic acid export membrane protein